MPTIRDWNEINAYLDWDAIKRAVRNPATAETLLFAPPGDGTVLKMIERALVRWAPRDCYTMEFVATEQHLFLPPEGGTQGMLYNGVSLPMRAPIAHGFLDNIWVLRTPWKSLDETMVGAVFINDWKTTRGTLDKTWVDRLEMSWQWKLYAAMSGAEYMIYRGVGVREGEREHIMKLPPAEILREVVQHQFAGYKAAAALYESRTSPEHPAWPRHMPYACGAYGNKCPYTDDCVTNSSPFVTISSGVLEKPWSYSSGERLSLCPERHRRYLIRREGLDLSEDPGDNLDETEETLLGAAFHRGMEEAYKQLKQLKEQGKI